jgi:hypothetical protein
MTLCLLVTIAYSLYVVIGGFVDSRARPWYKEKKCLWALAVHLKAGAF